MEKQNQRVREFFTLVATVSVLFIVVLYIIGRVSAEIFYHRFGISVASAGLSTPDVIGQAAGWAIWFLVLSFPAFFWGVMFSLGVDADTAEWLEASIVIGTFAATIALPLAAIFVLGDPGRLTDWALPVVSLGIGLTVLMLGLRDNEPQAPGKEDTSSGTSVVLTASGADTERNETGSEITNKNVEPASLPSEGPATAPAIQTTREDRLRPALVAAKKSSAFPYLAIIGVLFFVAIAISLIGLTQQADDAYAGRAEQASPWSFAPNSNNVEIVAPAENGLPVGRCLVEIAQGGDVWLLWDSKTRTLWRLSTEQPLRSCSP